MKKILVVDDDVDILKVVEQVLQMENYEVATAQSWGEIDNVVNKFKPDLILLDVQLSGADGRDICKKIKEVEQTKHISVLLFSALPDLRIEYRKCNADGFISKPFDLKVLSDIVKSKLAPQLS